MSTDRKSLVIVESPAKAKTINRFLGTGYVVKASMGHVRDLPETKLGIDIENDFKPTYVVIKGKAKIVKALKEAAEKANEIYLAPDMDREGEAIAWHIATLLDRRGKKIRRVVFNEITEGAIKKAFANPTEIDMRKVDSQQARRILDRLVGYLVSPLLWRVIYRNASAGRVQSVALRLICEREDEIARFIPKEYWTVEASLKSRDGNEFTASVEKRDDTKISIRNEDEAKHIVEDLKRQQFIVEGVESKRVQRKPKPPYITSTLQQDAANRLGFPARKTMVLAQELYEGVDLMGEERVGLITYMRTDSVRVSELAQRSTRDFILETIGSEYLPARPPVYSKRKSSQDAHEAIRPTDVRKTPDQVAPYLRPDQAALYQMIWQRFLASQMSHAEFDVTTLMIRAGRYLLKSTASVRVFDGYQRVYSEESGQQAGTGFADLKDGDQLDLIDIEPKQHFTQPPPRYTEARLIKDLEEKGIGRPSTYATILSTIVERRYVEKVKGCFIPTELGKTVMKLLMKLFPDVFEVGFTARMEAQLDKVESGGTGWLDVIKEFYGPFKESLDRANSSKAELRKAIEQPTQELCEKCGKPMVKKWSKHGQFLACSGFPSCKTTKPLEELEVVDVECPECGSPMVVKRGRFGTFLACSRYPECKGKRQYTFGIKCPRPGCDGEIVEKKTRKGKIFYGCQRYPDCDFASWDKPVGEPCPECGYPIMVIKSTKENPGYLKCPKCGFEIKP